MIKQVVTKDDAIQQGLTRYFTGKPCCNGHLSERRTYNSTCIQCFKERRKSSASRKEKQKIYDKNRRSSDEYKVYRRRKNVEYMFSPVARKKHSKNVLANKKRKMQELAGNKSKPDKCPLCGRSDQIIVFDHCHHSGKFRDWICTVCNKVLGSVKDNPHTLRRMANYLEKHAQESA